MNISDHNYFSKFSLDPSSDSFPDELYGIDFSYDDQSDFFDEDNPGKTGGFSPEDDDYFGQ